MTTTSVLFSKTRKLQIEDVKDDRLVADGTLAGEFGVKFSDLEDLDDLVSTTISTGRPEISEIVMCAKCVGECKVF